MHPRNVGVGDVTPAQVISVSDATQQIEGSLRSGQFPIGQFASMGMTLAAQDPQIQSVMSAILSGASTGAAIGTAVPIVGTLVGTIAGALVGTVVAIAKELGGDAPGSIHFSDGRIINTNTYAQNLESASAWVSSNPDKALVEQPLELAKTFGIFLSNAEAIYVAVLAADQAIAFQNAQGQRLPITGTSADLDKYDPSWHTTGALELLYPIQTMAASAILASTPPEQFKPTPADLGNGPQILRSIASQFPAIDPGAPSVLLPGGYSPQGPNVLNTIMATIQPAIDRANILNASSNITGMQARTINKGATAASVTASGGMSTSTSSSAMTTTLIVSALGAAGFWAYAHYTHQTLGGAFRTVLHKIPPFRSRRSRSRR